MKRTLIFVFVLILGVASCTSYKRAVPPQQLAAFSKLMASKTFTIASDWAYPQVSNAFSQQLVAQLLPPGNTAGAINLIGTPNFLRIENDSVFSELPYFGQRQFRVAYGGTDTGIAFKGLMKEYQVKTNKDASQTITFSADSHSEVIDVSIRIYPNLKVDMQLNGVTRHPIQYSGTVQIPKTTS